MVRKIFLMTLSFLVLLSFNCTINDSVYSPDSDGRVYGSGHLVKESRSMPEFNSVEISTAGKVRITYGRKQSVSVTTDDNIQRYISTRVCDGKLYIGIKNGVSLSNLCLTVDITMTGLEELVTSSAGSIEGMNKFKADDVSLIISSAGSICLELEAENLFTSLSSAGSMNLKGTVYTHQSIVSSAGNLEAFNLRTNRTTINLSSAGCASVYVTGRLNAVVSSVGSLFYKGNPVIYQTVSSLGRVVNAN